MIRTRNSSKRAAVDPRHRPRVHWDRLAFYALLEFCGKENQWAPHFNVRSTVSHRYKPTAWRYPMNLLDFRITIFQKDTHIPLFIRPNLAVRLSST